MNIGIDIQPLQYNARDAGIGFYIRNLLLEMYHKTTDQSIHLIVNSRSPRGTDRLKLHSAIDWPFLSIARDAKRQVPHWVAEQQAYPAMLEDADIILVHSNSLAELHGITIPPPTDRCRVVVTVHDIIPLVFKDKHPEYWSAALDGYDYARKLEDVCRADAIITVSEYSKRDLVQYLDLPEHIIFVAHGAAGEGYAPIEDTARIQRVRAAYKLPPEYILYVGGYYGFRKNIEGLLGAYRRYLTNRPKAPLALVLAGAASSPRREELKTLIDGLKLGGEVHLTDYVADRDLPVIYSEAAVFFYPSLYEGFGLTPLQAMACGTPVVTSNVASIPEVVGQAAELIDPNDMDEMAQALHRLSTDMDAKADRARRGLQRARHFSWARTASRTLEIYDHVLKRSL